MTLNRQALHDRTIGRLLGVSFLLSTVFYMLGSGLIEAVVSTSADLVHDAAATRQLIGGVVLQLMNSAAVVAIGVLFYPIMRRRSEAVALGYVCARVSESLLLAIGALATLMLIGASQAASPELGKLLVEGSRRAYQTAMIALGLGSLPFCALLYRSRLIPRPLSALGLLGYTALLVGSVLEIFGFDLQLLHNLPGGFFELALPIWLLVKGFDSAALAASEAEGPERARRVLAQATEVQH